MKMTKQNFLAIGLTAGLVALSSQVYAQDNNENTLPKAPTVTSQELAQDATHLFSNIGSAFKTGLQKVGATTGKVMQTAGEGLQHVSGVEDTSSKKEVASNNNETQATQHKDKKHKKSHYTTEESTTQNTTPSTNVASNMDNNSTPSVANPAEKVMSGAKDKVVGAISWLRSKATAPNNDNDAPKPQN